MSKYITAANVTAVLSVFAVLAGYFGKTQLASYLNNPETAQTLMVLVGSIGTLVAGALPGVKQ